MRNSLLRSLIPTSLGIDDVEKVKHDPKLAETVFMQRNDAIEKTRRLADEAESRLSTRTKASIAVLNISGSTLSSFGASDLSIAQNVTMLVFGIVMLATATALSLIPYNFLLNVYRAMLHLPQKTEGTPSI